MCSFKVDETLSELFKKIKKTYLSKSLKQLGVSSAVACIPQVNVNNSVTPQFTEGPVNADFSGVLQVEVNYAPPPHYVLYHLLQDPYLDTFVLEETALFFNFKMVTRQACVFNIYS